MLGEYTYTMATAMEVFDAHSTQQANNGGGNCTRSQRDTSLRGWLVAEEERYMIARC